MSEHNKTTQPLVTDEPKLSKHELKIYGFEHQPIVGNERIKAFANKYTAGDHESLVHHRNQSFKAGAWEVRAIYEKDRAALLRERDEALALLKTMEGEPVAWMSSSGMSFLSNAQLNSLDKANAHAALHGRPPLSEEMFPIPLYRHPSPQSDTLTVDSAMQVVREWKSLEMNGWSADAIWDNLEHLLTKAAAK